MKRNQTLLREASVRVSDRSVSLEQIIDVAESFAPVQVSEDPEYLRKLKGSVDLLHAEIARGKPVYGVTTGFGHSCGHRPRTRDVDKLGENLIRFHGCGTGAPLSVAQSRATMFCRMISLAKGLSGVSPELLARFADFLNHGISPVIPSQGSVGASGDLTPLSYVAASLAGHRKVIYKGRCVTAGRAIRAAGLGPYRFRPKEPLAIMNGTSVMTGIAALVVARSRRVMEAVTQGTALCVHGLRGHSHHFHPGIFRAKPFPGQEEVAVRIRSMLRSEREVPESDEPDHLQDPYSIRCAPHVIGVLADGLAWIASWVETEANSVNDNPILDTRSGETLMGGNFYGGHITFAMDGLKTALAGLCDLCDRQIALLVDPRFSRGLPPNLARTSDREAFLHHGFKGLQITASALTAEALKLATPASVFSRSTESHNQDKVSLGTLSSRDADEICLLAQRTAAIHLMASAQACRYRGDVDARPGLAAIVRQVEAYSPPYEKDRPMDEDVERLAQAIGNGSLGTR
jgi:histidine ammonia-lyase